jgi:hypothetical protein
MRAWLSRVPRTFETPGIDIIWRDVWRLDPWLGADDLGINEGIVAVADLIYDLWTIQQINRSSARQLRSQPISSAARRRFL